MIDIKKGELLIRDIMFIMLIMSSILVFSSTFVLQMADNYDAYPEAADLQSEYALKSVALNYSSGMFSDLNSTVIDSGSKIDTNLFTLLVTAKDIVAQLLRGFLTAPYQVGSLVGGIAEEMGLSDSLVIPMTWTITIALWLIIIFALITAFLQGAKV